ncbi:DEAD/DEAH box helicase [Leuconostoc lactis]|uniref:DEAD/DEAH box helicase n=1 Tax=Leuconostoc lactis TaxID=1246 RepID=UPI000A052FFB|nr:DEAD/DEAH box helicase family protein [Leuconostoc lactis]ORI83148.1 restriction endonuclease subunit R [Leuconostoc lactis]ORI85396.1 restriction endonuclease subunit R [Leuconostoc lactis]
MSFKESDLVLNVSTSVDPEKWDEGFYQTFLNLLFKNRQYQKEATEVALRYMNSGEYNSLEDLAKENFHSNEIIRSRWNENFDAMRKDLPLPDKLSATLDLATGTGKSYVMAALALIMLASKKVDRVLVLVPSLTIEKELTEKFKNLLSNDQLIKSLGNEFVTPELLNGDSTIVRNSIAIENRDAIYSAQAQRNSIVDSLKENGNTTLVLNDEVHHVYSSESNEWKKFIADDRNNGIDFKYVIGLTGTAYKSYTKTGLSNEYFSDVIFRYSLREAIEQRFIKNIEYVSKEDMPADKNERWQVILNSHNRIASTLENTLKQKPITIIVTGSTRRSDSQAESFKAFLKKQRHISDHEVNEIVLSVHSKPSAAMDRLKLANVDKPENPVEFIFSVSMLTEGWDVKRVFQIVPDEERAFNSKLLVAQVLGRGLRIPDGWKSEWGDPVVTVFNHEKWAANVRSLVEEILELRKTITIAVNRQSSYNFNLTNIEYSSEATTKGKMKVGSYNLWENGVKLPTAAENAKSTINMTNINAGNTRTVSIGFKHEIIDIDILAEDLFKRFSDLEDKNYANEYKNLWPVNRIKKMIQRSLDESGNKVITKLIRGIFLSSLGPIFRDGATSVAYTTLPDEFVQVSTQRLPKETSELQSFSRNRTLFYTDDFENYLDDDLSKVTFHEISDTTAGYKQFRIPNKYNFKTPQWAITVVGNPETEFIKNLIRPEVSKSIDSFIKSSDMNFYQFEYSWQKGTHNQTGRFNPDWFIKQGDLRIVVETKDDTQINNPDLENIGKNKAALLHFDLLNQHFSKTNSTERYKFIFLTPKNYELFFDKLINQEIENYTSQLDYELDKK